MTEWEPHPRRFHDPKRQRCTLKSRHSPFPSPQSQATTIGLLSLWIYLFWMFHINGSIPSVPLAPGFLPLASSFQGSSIYILACVHASFLCLAESYSLYGSHFTDRPHPRVHSSGDRHLCWFHLLAFMNDVAISFCVNTFSFLFDVHLGVQLLDHRLILYPDVLVNLLSKGTNVRCAQSD